MRSIVSESVPEQMNQLVRLIARNHDGGEMREQIRALPDIVRRRLAREEQLLFGGARQSCPTVSASTREHIGPSSGVTLPG
ncbi:MAG TPA: hypothetical protein VKH82_05135 [Candidatus Binatia bacterium]|nr:hypothetical protein [Candidatus Binatia bacterium]